MPRRFIAWTATAAFFAGTLVLTIFTLAQVPRAATRVPWQDEWAMLEEYAAVVKGNSLWKMLWSPYWGHRLFIPRLIYFADIRWASLASLTWLTLLLQSVLALLVIFLAWRLLRADSSRLRFAVAVIASLNLMFSAIQIQTFTWNMQTMFPLVYVCGAGAFLLMSIGERGAAPAIAAAIAGPLTMLNGILILPLLAVQALYLKRSRWVPATTAILSAALFVVYFRDYLRPEMGMGIPGMLRHPIDAARMLALLLSAPLEPWPLEVRIGAVLLALAAAAYLSIRVARCLPAPCQASDRRWISALLAILAFLLLSAVGTVAGRLGSEWLSHRDFHVPPKYCTMVCAFWAGVAILILYTWRLRLHGAVSLSLWGAMFACLMFAHPVGLLTEAEDWSDFFRGADALGSALILDVHDETLLARLFDAPESREAVVAFMRERHIGIFSQPRAAWPGRPIGELFQTGRALTCNGAVEFADSIGGAPSGPWRIEGWALVDDLVVADSSGRVAGLARGGLRHRYIPGILIDARSATIHSGVRHSEWLGYIRQSAEKPWTIYGLSGRTLCQVAVLQ